MRGRAGKADKMGSSSKRTKICACQEGTIMNGSHRDGNCRSRRRSLLFHTRTRLVPVLTKSAPSSAAMASARFTAISPSTLLCITSSKRYRPSTTSTVVACFRLQPQHWPALLKVRSKKKSEPSRHGAIVAPLCFLRVICWSSSAT